MTRPSFLAASLGALCLTLAAAPAAAQTRVLVLADGSTRNSAVAYYNAAVSEFAAVVGAANVQGRNDLDAVTLRSDADDVDERKGIVLMTLHAAKGLEFDEVFLAGMEDGSSSQHSSR